MVLGKQPVLLSFFTTTCLACKDEIAALHTIYDEYKAKGVLFYLVLVRVDGEKDAEVLTDAHSRGYRIPVLYHRYPSSVFQTYLTDANNKPLPFPVCYIIDRSGKLVYAHIGFDASLGAKAIQPVVTALDAVQ